MLSDRTTSELNSHNSRSASPSNSKGTSPALLTAIDAAPVPAAAALDSTSAVLKPPTCPSFDVDMALRKQTTHMNVAGRQFAAPSTSDRPRPLIVSVEAAIGTGKSTLLRLLAEEEPSWHFVQEPVDIWQAVDGKFNLLEAFYKDPARYSFSFQTYCVLSRIQAVETALATCPAGTKVMIVERSWFSDRHTFARMLIDSQKMSPMEAALYEQWYSFACKNGPKFNGHLYLEANAATCMTRLKRRGRSEETAVTVEYQRDLIAHHESWLRTLDEEKVCRVNVDEDFLDGREARAALMGRIRDYVATLEAARAPAV